MAKHARYSPSMLENLEGCPCFQYIDDPDRTGASEGTLMHKAAETEDLSILETEEQKRTVGLALDYVRATIAGEKPKEDFRELTELAVEDLTFGTADRLVILGDLTMHVFDYKFGRKGASEAKNNFQLHCYVAGGFQRFPEVERAVGHILAPRAQSEPSVSEFTRDMLEPLKARIRKVLAEVNDVFKKPREHEELCKNCANAGRCPVLQQTALQVVQPITGNFPVLFDVANLRTPKDRALAQILATVLENQAEQIKKSNKAAWEAGETFPGFAIRSRGTGLRIKPEDNLSAIERLGTLLSREEIAECIKIRVSDIVTARAAKTGVPEKTAKEEVRELLGDSVQETEVHYLQKTAKDLRKLLQEVSNA